MYKFIAAISIFVRQFVLPNPFEPLEETLSVAIGEITMPIHPIVINIFAEPFLHFITYEIVGIYYQKGEQSPAWGSFLYLLFYIVHVGLIYIISCFGFEWAAIIIVLTLYVAAHIGIHALKNRLVYYH